MVSVKELLQRIYDELVAFATANTSLSNPAEHVGVLNRTKDIKTPFFGFEWDINPNAMGMGGNVRNGTITTDNNGSIESIERLRDYRAMIDFGVVLDGDNPRKRDEYLTEIQGHFSRFITDSSELHDDVRRVREAGAYPSGGGDGTDVGFRITYNIEFSSSTTVDIPSVDTIDWDLDAENADAYPEQY